MAEDDAIFDPSLMKKKKKKKTSFDLEGLGGDEAGEVEQPEAGSNPPEAAGDDGAGGAELDGDLDLESFGKKKKKKKKPFNMEDLDSALGEDGAGEGGAKDKEADDGEGVGVELSTTWAGSDRDYTYDELLQRVFEIILDKNPDMAAGRKPKFVMRPPQVLRVGTKKTSFANFTEICKTLHRQPKHLLDFLLAELGTSGSVDGNSQLIIKGRFQPKQIENVLRRYIKEYVTCHTCRSPETILQKDTRLFFLQCESCGSRCSVASIKSGFQAVTSKRAAIRAKTA
ncbi:hypothetical protein pipiens_001784 [Culex pipiens pipiens]|uniref:Eukaryotic translation initiation factor 2 subunit 2 n=1 Tax=Culex pipiens pipiens TaxID=38569 RepID=A0ABD1DUP5_CULPP